MDSAPKFLEILKVLSRHEVEFILVGGLAAIVQGAPIFTFDLDIVFLKTAENRQRLLPALLELDARYLDPAGPLLFCFQSHGFCAPLWLSRRDKGFQPRISILGDGGRTTGERREAVRTP
jgi:hypothetical protein